MQRSTTAILAALLALAPLSACDKQDEGADAKQDPTTKSNTVEVEARGVNVQAQDAKIVTSPDGAMIEDAQGNKVVAGQGGAEILGADGTKISADKDGNVQVVGPDGKAIKVDADGNVAMDK